MTERPWETESMPVPLIPFERTFEGFLDLEWVELTATSARVRFEAREGLKQPLGHLHGGIYCAVAETVASVATMHRVWQDGLTAWGLNNTASFLRPISAGAVDVVGRLRHRGETEWLWAHEFHDEQQRLCALVDVMIAVRPFRP